MPLTTTIGLTGSVGAGTYAASTCTVSKEIFLATDTGNKTYVFVVDGANMGVGDILEMRAYTKVLSGDAYQIYETWSAVGVQGKPNIVSPPIPANIAIQVSICQPVGTARAFKWALLSL